MPTSRKMVGALLGLVCLVLGASVRHCDADPIPKSWHADAELRDVFFVDHEFGWAVGDLGTIWHTQNGGEKWQLQPTNLQCQFNSVHFISRRHGWVAGGFGVPHTGRSVGVILETSDGGQTWKRLSGILLPWLTRVSFHTKQHGFAVGLATPLDPTGAWSTEDGGRTWTPIHGVEGEHWVAAAFQGTEGVLVGQSGRRAWLKRNHLANSEVDASHAVSARSAAIVGEKIGFTAHTRPGITVDEGATWHPLDVLAQGRLGDAQFHAIAAFREHVWMAGDPGTRVYHAHDFGRSFESTPSTAMLPLRSLYFQDAEHGWAVGSLGQILRTRDGGRSWRAQRGVGKRAAMLAIFPDERSIPWRLLTQASMAGEYRIHLVILATTQGSDEFACPTHRTLQDAAQRIGVSAEVLTGFTVDAETDHSVGELLRRWESRMPSALDHLARQLTSAVRCWRPDVVVTAMPSQGEQKGIGDLVSKLVQDACELAANDGSHSYQVTEMGLQPWTVSRLCGIKMLVERDLQRATTDDEINEAAQRSARMMGQVDEGPWSLVSLADGVTIGRDPFSGLNLPYESANRRKRTVRTIHLASQRQTARQRAHAKALLQSDASLVGQGAHRVEQALQLLNSFDEEAAGALLYQLAQSSAEQGDLRTSDSILKQFAEKYPQHALVDAALMKLVCSYSSAELRWMLDRSDPEDPLVQFASAEELISESKEAFNARIAQIAAQVTSQQSPPHPWKQGLELGRRLKSQRPHLHAEPRVVFPVAAMTRLDGQDQALTSFYRRMMALPTNNPWRRRAAAELALLEGSKEPDLVCPFSAQKPYLDGKLDDECWRNAATTSLGTATTGADSPSTALAIYHDGSHLYVAAQCRKVPGARYLPPRRPRPRDATLETDRIRLRFDTNRDYVSWFELEVDQRGWTRDSLVGQTHWNPTYFVASSMDETSWTLEMAIPLEELAGGELRTDAIWAVGFSRLVPSERIEHWNPANVSNLPRDLQGTLHLQ